jgi:hypothetical protein
MAEDNMNPLSDASALDARITDALQTPYRVEIPAGFVARVIAQLPPRVVLTPARYGYRAATACLVVLLALMLAFAHRATGASLLWTSIEWTFYVQFALLTIWLVARSAGYTLNSTF